MKRRTDADLARLIVGVVGAIMRGKFTWSTSRSTTSTVRRRQFISAATAPPGCHVRDSEVRRNRRARRARLRRDSTEQHETVNVLDAQRHRRVPDRPSGSRPLTGSCRRRHTPADGGRSHGDAAIGQGHARRTSDLPSPVRPGALDTASRSTTSSPLATIRTPLRARGHRSVTKLRVGTIANQRAQVSSGGSNANENASSDRLSRIVRSRARGGARLGRLGDQKRVADTDEVSKVAVKDCHVRRADRSDRTGP